MIGTGHQLRGKALTASHPARLLWVRKDWIHEIKSRLVVAATLRSLLASILETREVVLFFSMVTLPCFVPHGIKTRWSGSNKTSLS